MKIFQEFKEFAIRGNVVDMVVGIVVGAAFSKIVNSFVTDVLMPPIGMLTRQIDFTNLFISLSGGDYATLKDAQSADAVTINYGLFLNNSISFLIVAFCIFLVVKWINQLRRQEDVAKVTTAPSQKSCPYCFSNISVRAVRCPHCTSDLSKDVS